MKEIEVKILEIEVETIKEKLASLGASLSFSGELAALFYDYPDGRIRKAEEVIRLRKEGEEVVLAYKKRISKKKVKIMEEHETLIGNFEAMQIILKQLGLQTFSETRKFRTEYLLDGSHIVIDNYQDALAHIPPFLEIESPDVDSLNKLVNKLGFDRDACLSWDTYDLVRHYSPKKN